MRKIKLIYSIVLFFLCLNGILPFLSDNFTTNIFYNLDNNKKTPECMLTSVIFIHINNNWTETRSSFSEWCSGTGEEISPYTIFNISMTDNPDFNIIIENTREFFCLENISINGGDYGIFLRNITNGKVNQCNISMVTYNGIDLSNSTNLEISSNIINYSIGSGISLYDNCSSIAFSQNFYEGNNDGISLNNCNKISFFQDNITFSNENGMRVENNSHEISFDQCSFLYNYNNGIYTNSSEDISLFNSTIALNGEIEGNGMVLNNTSNIFINKTEFQENIWYNLYSQNTTNLILDQCNFSIPANVADIYCINNTMGVFLDNSLANLVYNNCSLYNLTSNTINSSMNHGILLERCKNFSIQNNNISNQMEDGINIYDSKNISIMKNQIENTTNAIILSLCYFNDIELNNISRSFNNGISLYHSNNNSISNNSCLISSIYGFILTNSSNNTIYYNYVRGSSEHGFYNDSLSIQNIIFENDFSIPSGSISTNSTLYIVDKTIEFTCTVKSDDLILNYTLNFGDLSPEITENINTSHIYTQNIHYDVILTVFDIHNDSIIISLPIDLELNKSPIAHFYIQEGVYWEDKNISFFDNSTLGNGMLTYSWDFGDGSPILHNQNSSHIFSEPGDYNISLVIYDYDQDPSIYSKNITIIPDTPLSGQIMCNLIIAIPHEEIFFTPDIIGDAPYSYLWDFGDDTQNVTSAFSSHIYESIGSYQVRLFISDASNDSLLIIKEVIIEADTIPIVNIIANITQIQNNGTIQFNCTVSLGNGILIYEWNFGDGAKSNNSNPNHYFGHPGTYNVTLRVWDRQEDMGMISLIIIVEDTTPIPPPFNLADHPEIIYLAIICTLIGFSLYRTINRYRKKK